MANQIIEKGTRITPEGKSKLGKEKTAGEKKYGLSGHFLNDVLNGRFMSKEFYINYLVFFLFLFGLVFLIVAKQYFVSDLVKETDLKQKSVDQMTSDYVSAKTKLQEETERLKLSEKLAPLGLKETTNPTKVIRIRSKE